MLTKTCGLAAAAALTTLICTGEAGAQATALAEANARVVCGAGVAVSAVYLPGGLLQVSCRAPSQSAATSELPAQLSGTGLSAGVVGAIAAGALLIVVVASGGDGDSSTTTTTTSTATGQGSNF